MTKCHDIELLVPWYVNGTLNEAEMDRVNQHLRDCRSCSDGVEREIHFARDLRRDPEGLDTLTREAPGWDALVERLPAGRRRPGERAVRLSAVIAGVMLAVAAGSFVLGQHLDRPVYRAMTSPATADEGDVVQVMFEPETPEHVIRGILLDSGGRLIAGPTATGIYRIGLTGPGDGRELVARLERSSAVRWTALEQP